MSHETGRMSQIDPARCPLCGRDNACAMVAGRATCWCFARRIPAEVLARVPEEARGVACLCARCAAGEPPPTPAG
jgi:hypothetical protein